VATTTVTNRGNLPAMIDQSGPIRCT
jgi:hypothetical protein